MHYSSIYCLVYFFIIQQGKMIKPNLNSVDLSELELDATKENVEDVYEEESVVSFTIFFIIRIHNKIV